MTCKNAAMKRHWGAVVRGLLSPALVTATHLPNWIEIKAKVVSLSLSASLVLWLSLVIIATDAARSAFECACALSHIFAVEAIGLPSCTRSCRSNICDERAIKICVCLFQQIIAYVGIIIHIKNKTYIYFIFGNVLEYINVWKLKNKLTKIKFDMKRCGILPIPSICIIEKYTSCERLSCRICSICVDCSKW